MRPTPEVIDGMRPTRNALAEKGIKVGLYARFKAMTADRAAKERAKRLDQQSARDAVFVSAYGNHRIQITAPRDVTLADGTKVQSKPLVAQFHNCQLKVREQFRHLEDEDVEKIVSRLRKHPRYGVGKDFWEQADAIDESKVRKMAAVAQTMEEDPVVKDAVLDYITAAEFEKNVKVASVAEAGRDDDDDTPQDEGGDEPQPDDEPPADGDADADADAGEHALEDDEPEPEPERKAAPARAPAKRRKRK